MTEPEIAITNANIIVGYFGYWPSFHDAEVISIKLDRHQVMLEAVLHVIALSNEVTESGHLKAAKSCIVTMRFYSIRDMILQGFNSQNALLRINFDLVHTGEIRVDLVPAYGLDGKFICRNAEVVSLDRTEDTQERTP